MTTEQDKAEVMTQLVSAGARLYHRVAEQALELLGPEGGVAVRHGVRNYMGWRGAQMRKAHAEIGLPLNVQSVCTYWDSASVHACTVEVPVDKPYDVRMNVSTCPLADVWKEAGFQVWGHIFCDEAHQALLNTYHPDATVVIHQNLNKSDPACTFRWAMPPQPEGTPIEPDPKGGQTRIGNLTVTREIWNDSDAILARASRILGAQIYYGVKELVDRFGKDGEEALRRGIRRHARDRAAALQKAHAARNLPQTVETFINHLDVPYVYAWEKRGESFSSGSYSAEVTNCPFAEVWAQEGDPAAGRIYCEEVYPALVAAYKPGSTVEMRKMIPRGDSVCAFTIKM